MARIKYYDPTSNTWKYADKGSSDLADYYTKNEADERYAQKSELADKQDKALVVNIERIGGAGGGSYTADKTNAEIYAAWQAGQEVIASINGAKLPCLQADATSAYFNSLIGGDGVSYGLLTIITTGGTQTVTVSMTALQPTTITDTAGYFTTDTVEGALAEIGAKLAAYPSDVWEGGSYGS